MARCPDARLSAADVRIFLSIASIVLAVLLVTPAHADTLRCGSVLVQPGDMASYVLAKCGAPESKSEIHEPIMARRANGTTYRVGTTTQEIWRYARRAGQFPAVLTFEGGVLKKLEFEK